MNHRNITFILITTVLLGAFPQPIVNDHTKGANPFYNRISKLQDDTGSLCTHIEKTVLISARKFKQLMNEHEVNPPDYSAIEAKLSHVQKNANQHHSAVEKQLDGCRKLFKMLTRGLESGGIAASHLHEGNYSVVNSILDKWHQAFTEYSKTFYASNIPMETIQVNIKVFYHDDRIQGLGWFIIRILSLIFVPLVVAWVITRKLSSIGVFNVLNRPFENANPLETTTGDPSKTPESRGHPKENSAIVQRKNIPPEIKGSNGTNQTQNLSPKKNKSSHVYSYVCLFFLYFVVFAMISINSPNALSPLQSTRYNWYPDATTTFETMKKDLETLQSNLAEQIESILELQRGISMYLDETFQKNVDEMRRSLVGGFRQASKEYLRAYVESRKLKSKLTETYEIIEGKAKKAGRLEESQVLLNQLHAAGERYDVFHHALSLAVDHQKKALPTLKEQTDAMRVLVQNDRLIDMGRLASEHSDIVLEIDGQVADVKVAIQSVLEIVGDDTSPAMKNQIQSLQITAQYDQYKAILLGGGSVLGAFSGIVATGWGLSIVSIVVAPAAIPLIGAVGVIGSLAGEWYGLDKSLYQYEGALQFKIELASLEEQRIKVMKEMEGIEKAIADQQKALESVKSTLAKLIMTPGQFTKIAGFSLNKTARMELYNELIDLTSYYNEIIAVYKLFTIDSLGKEQIDYKTN